MTISIADINEALQAHSSEARSISSSTVKAWMTTHELEVRGFLYARLTNRTYYTQIRPSLQFQEVYEFVITYLLDCIRDNLDGEWVHSPYIAAHELNGWIISWWHDQSVPPGIRTDIVKRLEAAYLTGDDKLRKVIVLGSLEHLFEDRKILQGFAVWKRSPELANAYHEALLWSNGKHS